MRLKPRQNYTRTLNVRFCFFDGTWKIRLPWFKTESFDWACHSLSVCEQSSNMKLWIFCCTRPWTGSRKFKHRLRQVSFRFQQRAEIKRSILAQTRFKHVFFLPKSDKFSHRVIIAISKTGQSEWRNLVNLSWLWQCNVLVCILTVAILAFVSGQRTSCLSLSLSFFFFFIIVLRWRLGQDRQRKMKKASSFYRLRQATIAEKMKRWKDACLSDEMWPRSLGGWGWSLYFPSYARVHMKAKTLSFSLKT